MLISISYSVSCEVSGTKAVAAEGRSGDLNAEDLDTPFLLMGPRRKLKLSYNQICLSMFLAAACPDLVCVSLPYLVR